VKGRSILISLLSITFSAIFLVVASGTKAETQDGAKKDLVSVLHLVAPSLLGPKDSSGEKKDSGRGLSVPMKDGLQAFLDFASPPYPGLEIKTDNRTEHRAIVGFHFRF